MDLNRFKFNLNDNYSGINDLNINNKPFEQITGIIKDTFTTLKYGKDNMNVYYQRYKNGSSILAIKVLDGDEFDITNYMFNGCSIVYYNNKISSTVSFHSDKRATHRSMAIANLISDDIILFFREVEEEILSKDLKDLELNIKMPLYELKKEETGIKQLVKNIFKNKK
jgi:hypothetical protein